jgi:hypothetical protein
LKTSIYIQIVIRWASIHRLSICIIDLPTTANLAGIVSQETKLFGSRLCYLPVEAGRVVQLEGISQPGRVNEDGLFIPGTDGRWVNVRMLQVGTNSKLFVLIV